ncbi:site-specific integrase [uncultured Duncaniella sp.]|uniref:site-specific integrase n=2 Tax=uncultured Duncaniella sp. TaxID=2768039 RepID=UPI0027312ED8|nr:site-specific integrase [uncultured Duncaniella sp.]
MASIKVKFRPSTVADHEGTIYYQIIHERKVRQLLSDYKVYPSEWDESRSMVMTTQKSERKSFILSIRERIRWDVERLMKIDRKLDANGLTYTADDVIDEFARYSNEYSLFNFMQSMIVTLKQRNQLRTAETYKAALNSFKKFRINEDVMLDTITSDMMLSYESHLKHRGNTPNTISFYMRILRAVYNNAVDNEVIENRNPFRKVFTGAEKTIKRALNLTTIKKIKNLDLSLSPKTDFARDMFMMSFYLRGMSFIDMAYLRKTDLENGHMTYRRRKTGQQLTIEWTKEMQMILDKYPENPTRYLLPIITKEEGNQRRHARNVNESINHHLKKVAEKVGVLSPLTMYCARHSWASAAKAKGIPLSVISEGMGHDSEATTQIYLASLETSVVDKANALILKSL